MAPTPHLSVALVMLTAGLAGCAPPPPPPAPVVVAPQPAPPPPPPAFVEHDGTYAGSLRLSAWRSPTCGVFFQRAMTVRNGRASMVFNLTRNLAAEGVVEPSGIVALTAPEDATRIDGRFNGERFLGTYQSPDCDYAVVMTRR